MSVHLVDKPLGMTSHDVVAVARKRLGTRQVGHAGTLDPLATGVLVVLAEEETKLSPFLTGSAKGYLAWICFGLGTPTLDAEGPVSEEGDAAGLDAAAVEAALPPFLELREQVPPQFSAVKRAGVKGYEAARRGESLELPARPAGYRRLELLAFAASLEALPRHVARDAQGRWRAHEGGREAPLPTALGRTPSALLALEVAAGTYVRALARDLGSALGVPAHLGGLLRTHSGRLDLERTVALDELEPGPGLSPVEALPYPLQPLSAEEAQRVRQGQRLPATFEGRAGLVDPEGALVAVAEVEHGRMKLLRVWR